MKKILERKQKYIMHLDGDAFFVSVEMAKDPSLRGRPVVTGQERGIASALSYEAKKLGITRAMPIFQIRKQFPQVVVVSSDYEAYAIFSRRMFDIVSRYTDEIEEYSIDECFADFSNKAGFVEDPMFVLSKIKSDIKKELGISVSLGLGPTKVLAKTASKLNKPDGLTILGPNDIASALDRTPVDKVWGIGFATSFALRKLGVRTALELAQKPLLWVEGHFSKPMAEMWHELNGISVHNVMVESEQQKSIMKTRTFIPNKNREHVFSELAKNIENACRKAREMGLAAREFSIYLKTQDFTYHRNGCRLMEPSNNSFEIIKEARGLFSRVFEEGGLYRSTGVTLYALIPGAMKQDNLFEITKPKTEIFGAVDKLNKKYGRSVVHIATSSRAIRREEGLGFLRRLAVPYLGEVF
jgi:DNA polymerase IV